MERQRNYLLDNRPTSDTELLLIRIGHHLWRSYKRQEWPNEVVFSALQTVWDLKETVRRPLRKAWLESLKKRIERLSDMRKQRKGGS
jgi:hypothetical protein